MKMRILSVVFLLCLAAALPAASPRKLATPKPAAGSSVGLTPDKGKFRILQQGQEVGTEQFEISQSGSVWTLRDDAVTHLPTGGDSHSTGLLRLSADGTPIHYEWTVQSPRKASGAVDFSGGTAKTSLVVEGKNPFHEDFNFPSAKIAVLDNNLYDQYTILAQLYDWNAKGTQTFPVVIPQDMTPGSITIESLGPDTEGGASLDGLRMRTADLEIDIYFDAKHRLMRLEVPAAKVEITRQ